jgi:hypothetical protein
MRKVVGELIRVIPDMMRKYDFNTIAVTGKSGTALGFAAAMHIPGLHVVAVRKGESTHGDMVEGLWENEFSRYAFFDDFVATGCTLERVHGELTRKACSQGDEPPSLALIIEYATTSNSTRVEESGLGAPRLRLIDPDRLMGTEFFMRDQVRGSMSYRNTEGFSNNLVPA